jgi:hypothetical protein
MPTCMIDSTFVQCRCCQAPSVPKHRRSCCAVKRGNCVSDCHPVISHLLILALQQCQLEGVLCHINLQSNTPATSMQSWRPKLGAAHTTTSSSHVFPVKAWCKSSMSQSSCRLGNTRPSCAQSYQNHIKPKSETSADASQHNMVPANPLPSQTGKHVLL